MFLKGMNIGNVPNDKLHSLVLLCCSVYVRFVNLGSSRYPEHKTVFLSRSSHLPLPRPSGGGGGGLCNLIVSALIQLGLECKETSFSAASINEILRGTKTVMDIGLGQRL